MVKKNSSLGGYEKLKDENKSLMKLVGVFATLVIIILIVIFFKNIFGGAVDKKTSDTNVVENIAGYEIFLDIDDFYLNLKDKYKTRQFGECLSYTDIKNCLRSEIARNIKEGADISICSDLYGHSEKENCIYSSLIEKGRVSGDHKLCSALDTADRKKACEYEILLGAAISLGDKKKCSPLSDSGRRNCENRAIISKAIKDLDKEVCEEITEDFLKTECENSVDMEMQFEEARDLVPELSVEETSNVVDVLPDDVR